MHKHSYWWDLGPHNNNYYDFVPSEAEVVVIGAGVAGIAAAYWLLADKQRQIVMIDSSPFPGYRGAGREFGMLLANGGKHFNELQKRVGSEKAESYLRLTRSNNILLRQFIERNKIPCKLEMNGGLRLAGCVAEAKSLRECGRMLRELEIEAVSLSENEIESIVPSNKLHGGLFVPGEGTLDPFAFVTYVTRILHESVGLRFCHAVGKVESIEPSARDAFRTIHLDNGHSIKTRVVIHANGDSIPPSNMIIPFREHAIASEDLPDTVAQCFPRMSMLTNGGDDYFRLDDTRLLGSGGRFASRDEIPSKNDVSYNPHVYNALGASLARMFPVSTIAGHAHAWAMISYDTPDGLPLIGSLPDDHRQFIISGLGSHRYSVAFIAGRIVAEQIRGKDMGAGVEAFAPGRFTA